MKIAGFGAVCLDCIASIGALDINKTAVISKMEHKMGGMAANALLAASRLGADTSIISALGDDSVGHTILSLLEKENIDTKSVKIFPDKESYFSFIRIDEENAERYIYCKRDTVKADEIDADESLFADADVFLLDSHFLPKSAELAKKAYELGIPTVGDFKISPEKTEILKYTEYPIISKDYALSLSKDGSIESALFAMAEFNPKSVPVITCGEEGCRFLYEGQVEHIPAFDIVPVDTAAAGDVFHGGFAYAIGAGYSVRSALVFASAVSAIKCMRFGGSSGTPELWEVKDFLAKRNF